MRVSSENLDNYGRNWNSIICYEVEKKNIRLKNIDRGQPGSNRWPLDLQSNALPLSYAPW